MSGGILCPITASEPMAVLTLRRQTTSVGVFRKLAVKIDGQTRANLQYDECKDIELEPGEYELRAWMDWTSSPPFQVTIEENEERPRELVVGVIPFPLALIKCFISPYRIFTIKDVQSSGNL